MLIEGLLQWLSNNESSCRDKGFDPWVGKIPWRMEWQPTPVFTPGKSRGQRNLLGYSLPGREEADTTERFTLSHRSRRSPPPRKLMAVKQFIIVKVSPKEKFFYEQKSWGKKPRLWGYWNSGHRRISKWGSLALWLSCTDEARVLISSFY